MAESESKREKLAKLINDLPDEGLDDILEAVADAIEFYKDKRGFLTDERAYFARKYPNINTDNLTINGVPTLKT